MQCTRGKEMLTEMERHECHFIGHWYCSGLLFWSTLIKNIKLKKWSRDIRGRLLSSPESFELMDVLHAMNTYVTHPRIWFWYTSNSASQFSFSISNRCFRVKGVPLAIWITSYLLTFLKEYHMQQNRAREQRQAWRKMPAWTVLEDSPCRCVVEESNSRSPPRAHHPKQPSSALVSREGQACCLPSWYRETSPLRAHKTCFSLHDHSFPWQPCFFSIGTPKPGCEEMDLCEKQNFHRSCTYPQQMEMVQMLMLSKVYTMCIHFSTFERSNNENHIANRKNKLILNFKRPKKESLSLKKIPGACKNKDELFKCTHLDFVGVTENWNHKCTPCVTIFFLKAIWLLCYHIDTDSPNQL